MPWLKVLDASFNQLSGPIPDFFNNNIQQLYLDHNALSGSVPSKFGNTSSLRCWSLDHNPAICGVLPAGARCLDPTGTNLGETQRLASPACRNNHVPDITYRMALAGSGPAPAFLHGMVHTEKLYQQWVLLLLLLLDFSDCRLELLIRAAASLGRILQQPAADQHHVRRLAAPHVPTAKLTIPIITSTPAELHQWNWHEWNRLLPTHGTRAHVRCGQDPRAKQPGQGADGLEGQHAFLESSAEQLGDG